MARDVDDYPFEDECCLNCGEMEYTPSRVPGLCKACANPEELIEDIQIYREIHGVQ